jgi:hypothetical protein
MLAAAALALCAVAAAMVLRMAEPPRKFLITPDAGISVAVFMPDSLAFLRPQLLRVAIAQAHLRGGETVGFQREQTRNPFAGPHLQVIVGEEAAGRVEAEFLLRQEERTLRERYVGSVGGVRYALQTWLARALSPDARAPDKATEYFVSAREAELHFDRERALFDYQRALLREPAMLDAEIGVARVLAEQGRTEEAVASVERLIASAQIGTAQRCRVEALAVLAPEAVPVPMCPHARMIANVEKLELRAALDEAERSYRQRYGASEWLRRQDAVITALLRQQKLPQAAYEVDRAQRFARDAGWDYAEARLREHRISIEIHAGRIEQATAMRYRLADDFEAMGDAAVALGIRQVAYRHDPPALGAAVAQRRRQLIELIDRAKALGAVTVEVDAMLQLTRLERDDPEVWRGLIERVRSRMRDAGMDGHRTLHPYFLAHELLAQRRYRDTLAEIDRLAQAPVRHPRAATWELPQRVHALFALDEPKQAVRAIDAIDAAGLTLSATPNACLFAWVLAEADEDAQARDYLGRCERTQQDRPAQATRADYALLAEWRLARTDAERAQATAALRQRIEALSTVAQPLRPELESLAQLTLFAMHTTDNSAGPQGWGPAIDRIVGAAGQEGAGPAIRLGAHLLRYRACRERRAIARAGSPDPARAAATPADSPAPGERDCGPVLPPWAAEDRLWARLAAPPGR